MSTQNDNKLELEALFTKFIYAGDATHNLDSLEAAAELAGQRWGWVVGFKAADLYDGLPTTGLEYQGIKETEKEAVDAAVGYIWAVRGDIVKECKAELARIRAYAAAKASGKSGNAVN